MLRLLIWALAAKLTNAGAFDDMDYDAMHEAIYDLAKEQAPLTIRRIVARMHFNFGHPSRRGPLRFAASQGANQTALL